MNGYFYRTSAVSLVEYRERSHDKNTTSGLDADFPFVFIFLKRILHEYYVYCIIIYNTNANVSLVLFTI